MIRLLVVSRDGMLQRRIRDALTAFAEAELVILESCPDPDSLGACADGVMLVDGRCDSREQQRLTTLLSAAVSADLPVIVLGEVDNGEAEAERYLDMGANDILPLNFRSTELKARTRVQLRLKRRLDQLRQDAVVDQTTGVYNRRFMETQLAAQLAEAWRYHHPFSFGILDIDHFKRINDSFGHRFGDQVLRQLGALLRGMIRREDTLTRYGGEEFALLLPHTDRSGAWMMGERCRAAVEEHAFRHENSSARITASIGLATYPSDAQESAEELVACADRRLYRAKNKGRNRVINS